MDDFHAFLQNITVQIERIHFNVRLDSGDPLYRVYCYKSYH